METVNLKKNDLNLVGTTGEYLVCAELGKREILAVLTPKNNPLFDIIAISRDAKKSVAIQVKTMSSKNKQGWKFTGQIVDYESSTDRVMIKTAGMDGVWYAKKHELIS